MMPAPVLPAAATRSQEPPLDAAALSERIWRERYRMLDDYRTERSPQDSFRRVAQALAQAEHRPALWEPRFLALLQGWEFMPGGRILANAGAHRADTLCNCFVLPPLDDSARGMRRGMREIAETLGQGGGVGLDLSRLAPAGPTHPGPTGALRLLEDLCAHAGGRRRSGAAMAALRADHADILPFVQAAAQTSGRSHLSLSVLVDQAFFDALDSGRYTGLWHRLADAARQSAQPGLLFIDRINQANPLWYRETLSACNPCGELPLPPYGACTLGSLNLPRLVRHSFTPQACFDFERLERVVATAVRMLDNALSLTGFPLSAQAEEARAKRRIGLGITGLADALLRLGLHYAQPQARHFAARLMHRIQCAAYSASIALAAEKGAFPALDATRHLEGETVRALPHDIRAGIARSGLRNSHLTAIAPAGSISLFAGNVSSGMEPITAGRQRRQLRAAEGGLETVVLENAALTDWRRLHGTAATLPPQFVIARDVPVAAQLRMQSALQPHVDSAVAKTVLLPASATAADVADVFLLARRLQLKGCTLLRSGSLPQAVVAAFRCPAGG